VKDGKATPVPVTVGPSDLADTVVLAGVTIDDVVVVGPYKSLVALKPDQKVAEKKEESAGGTAKKDEPDEDPEDVDRAKESDERSRG
jgi:hypothetical protein